MLEKRGITLPRCLGNPKVQRKAAERESKEEHWGFCVSERGQLSEMSRCFGGCKWNKMQSNCRTQRATLTGNTSTMCDINPHQCYMQTTKAEPRPGPVCAAHRCCSAPLTCCSHQQFSSKGRFIHLWFLSIFQLETAEMLCALAETCSNSQPWPKLKVRLANKA